MNEIATLISNIGFPITIALILLKYVISTENKNNQMLISLKESIDHNSELLLALINKLESEA